MTTTNVKNIDTVSSGVIYRCCKIQLTLIDNVIFSTDGYITNWLLQPDDDDPEILEKTVFRALEGQYPLVVYNKCTINTDGNVVLQGKTIYGTSILKQMDITFLTEDTVVNSPNTITRLR